MHVSIVDWICLWILSVCPVSSQSGGWAPPLLMVPGPPYQPPHTHTHLLSHHGSTTNHKPPSPPQKHCCPPCLLISMYVCLLCVFAIVCPAAAPVCLHVSDDITERKGEVCLEVVGCPRVAVTTASSTGGLSLWKAFKTRKKKELSL